MARALIHGNADVPRCLVVIFLRGGADGLHLVVPHGDDDYYRLRSTLAVAVAETVPLDAFFGLHPSLGPLAPFYGDGRMAVVHAAGSEDQTRSHFAAQDLMEHGGEVAGGWLGRFLRARDPIADGPLAAIAIGETLPESLRGAPAATAVRSLDDFALGEGSERILLGLEALYAAEAGPLGDAAVDTLNALRRIEELRRTPYRPAEGVEYPRGEFGEGLYEVARCIKAGVGLEVATVDLGGWDSHLGQAALVDPLMGRLAQGLSAFCLDLGPLLDATSVVVMTEFGRRVAENASLGTDHGRASAMFVLGGGVQGGQVVADWPGLRGETLEGPGDLPVVHDFRDVLAPVLRRHGAVDLQAVFPDHLVQPMAL